MTEIQRTQGRTNRYPVAERSGLKRIIVLGLLMLASIPMTACSLDRTSSRINPPPAPTMTTGARVVEQKPTITPTVEIESPVEQPTETSAPPSPTVAASPTPTVVPTLYVPGMIGPDSYADNVNPLTGLEVNNPEILARRPLAIKISNNARVRPQAGLNSADLVFEHLTEGGITRLTAIYYGKDASKVGSIRSGRLIDLELPIMYDAAFGYSGSSIELRLMFLRSLFFDRIVSPDFAHGGYERISNPEDPDERVEDTLYTSTDTLRWLLDQRGQDIEPVFSNGMAFHPDPPGNGSDVSGVEIAYPATSAYWYHSPGLGGYLRWSDGIPHLDANSGNQLLFQNIVVIRATHLATDIIEDSGGSPLTFHTSEGDLLPLSPGKTFFQVVPLDFTQVYDTS